MNITQNLLVSARGISTLVPITVFLLCVPFQYALTQQSLQIHGLLQARANVLVDSSIYDRFTRNTFFLRRGEVSLSSELLDHHLAWEVRVDPISLSGKIVQDAFIECTLSSALKLRLGQFKYPQSLDGQWSTAKLDLIRRSLVGEIFGDKRDIGVQARGILQGFEYAAGVFNGSGRNAVDNNNGKDFAGRVTIRPKEWLSLGGSFYGGSHLYNENLPEAHDGNLRRLGGDVRLSWNSISIQAEYMEGGDDVVYSRGWYAQSTFAISTIANVAARVEQFDPDRDHGDKVKRVLTIGGNCDFEEGVKASLAFFLVDDQQTLLNPNELIFQWQIVF